MSKHVLRVSLMFIFSLSLVFLPIMEVNGKTNELGKLSPSTPISSDGSINTDVKYDFSGAIIKENEAYVPSYEGMQNRSIVELDVKNLKSDTTFDGKYIGINSIIGTDNRIKVNNTTTYPYSAIVHVVSDIGGCSGWMIGPDTVATAGHCIYDASAKKWASWAYIYPGRDGGNSPYGVHRAKSFHSVTGWTNSGNTSYDYGAIKLQTNVGYNTGWFGYRWTSSSLYGTYERISGYPGDKAYGTQWLHSDWIRQSLTYKLHYANDTFPGQSGSPVYQPDYSGCGVCGIAIHTNGVYGGVPYNRGTRIREAVFNNFGYWKGL